MVFKRAHLFQPFLFLLLFVSYFVTRLDNLMSLPIFTDEAIYVRWSQIAKQDASWRFISLTDGKQPMFVWLAMNSMRIFHDPLLASRMVSVMTGFGALLGIIMVTLELFKKKREGGVFTKMFGQLFETKTMGIIAGTLFVLFPFALVYDRLALYDSTVAFTMIWCLYFEILLVKYLRLDIALLTGFVIGLAMLTKTSGFFALYLMPFSLVLFDFKTKKRKEQLIKWIVFAGISAIIANVLYAILRLSPFFYIINEKNALFVRPTGLFLHEFLVGNYAWFQYIQGNFSALVNWVTIYVGYPVLILAAASFFLKGYFKEKLLLLSWSLIPYVALGVFGNTLYPRFIYFMTLSLLVLATYSLYYAYVKLKRKFIFYLLFILIVLPYLYADYFIIFDFAHAPLPKADLGQYSNDWPAGGGVREMVSFFSSESQKGKIFVLTQGTFGSLPTYSMEIYLGNNKNIEKEGIYPLPSLMPQKYLDLAKKMPVYVVLNDSENPPSSWPLSLIAKYQKGIGDRHLSIYKVNQ